MYKLVIKTNNYMKGVATKRFERHITECVKLDANHHRITFTVNSERDANMIKGQVLGQSMIIKMPS